jgi:CubicO group peptidase (beta-lactamase class C family)
MGFTHTTNRRLQAAIAVMLLAALMSTHKPVLAAEDAPAFAVIDRYVASWMHAARLPGVALGIVRGEEIVHLRGFGIAGPSGAPQTPFAVASLTKSFTTLAIMQLVEAGKVEWDAPVQRYLPWFRVADADASARITLRQLATHTSGLTEAMENDSFFAQSLLEPALAGSPWSRWSPARTTFAYGNLTYSLLGLVVEAASGQPYDAYVHKHILAPSTCETPPCRARTPAPMAGQSPTITGSAGPTRSRAPTSAVCCRPRACTQAQRTCPGT